MVIIQLFCLVVSKLIPGHLPVSGAEWKWADQQRHIPKQRICIRTIIGRVNVINIPMIIVTLHVSPVSETELKTIILKFIATGTMAVRKAGSSPFPVFRVNQTLPAVVRHFCIPVSESH